LGEDNYLSAYNSDKGMIEAMVVWVVVMKDREEMLQEERKGKENKRKRKQKEKSRKERKRMRNYAELGAKPSTNITTKRRRARALRYENECEYDDEQCAYYHRNLLDVSQLRKDEFR
jgi:hypothetical protein